MLLQVGKAQHDGACLQPTLCFGSLFEFALGAFSLGWHRLRDGFLGFLSLAQGGLSLRQVKVAGSAAFGHFFTVAHELLSHVLLRTECMELSGRLDSDTSLYFLQHLPNVCGIEARQQTRA